MKTLKDQTSAILKRLEAIRTRPQVFIGQIDSKSMEHYLYGFMDGVHLFADDQLKEKHNRIIEEVAHARGWPMSLSYIKTIRDKGLSEREIIDEIVLIQIESWKRLDHFISLIDC